MVSQVTEWIGSDLAKKPSEGSVRKDPVIPCSWIKSEQRKDNGIQEKTKMFKWWKIICSEPNPAFQNTQPESELSLVHNSISQGLHMRSYAGQYQGQLQNFCPTGSAQFQDRWKLWNGYVLTWSTKIGLGRSKSFLCCSNILDDFLKLASTEGVKWKCLGSAVELYQIHGSTSHQSTVQITATLAHLYEWP